MYRERVLQGLRNSSVAIDAIITLNKDPVSKNTQFRLSKVRESIGEALRFIHDTRTESSEEVEYDDDSLLFSHDLSTCVETLDRVMAIVLDKEADCVSSRRVKDLITDLRPFLRILQLTLSEEYRE